MKARIASLALGLALTLPASAGDNANGDGFLPVAQTKHAKVR